jgi:tetratricopeptide (TPR) repeat protein
MAEPVRYASFNLVDIYSDSENVEQAIAFYQRCLAAARDIKDIFTESEVLCNLAATVVYLNQLPEAMQYNEECLQICQRVGNAYPAAFVYKNLAEVTLMAELPELVTHFYREAFKLSSQLGIPLAEDCQTIFERLDQNRN